jgi:hypothetical protein
MPSQYSSFTSSETYHIDLELSTAEADTLQDLFDLDDESGMEDWSGELDVTEMSGTFRHSLQAGLTFKVAVNGWHCQTIQ